jgi:hypothetical protein
MLDVIAQGFVIPVTNVANVANVNGGATPCRSRYAVSRLAHPPLAGSAPLLTAITGPVGSWRAAR